MAVMIPNTIPGILQTIIGQSFSFFNEPYKVQAVQFIAVITGKIIDPVWPDKFNLIWSMYEVYIAIAINDANHPILLTIFSFI